MIANLALWTKLAGAIGAAVAGAVWRSVHLTRNFTEPLRRVLTDIGGLFVDGYSVWSWYSGTMPTNLSNQLRPLGLSAADIKKIYGSIKTAKSQPANVRAAVIIGAFLLPDDIHDYTLG